jgi:hypothetical protein
MSDQKLPQKIKKKSNKLKEEDKEKCDNYYLEVNKFIEKNDTIISKKIKEINYNFIYDKEKNIFISDFYDHQNLEAYGYYNKKQKKIYLSVEEAFYLNQIGIITFKEEFDFNDLNLIKLNLYSYLRRNSKISLVCKLLLLYEKIINIKKGKELDKDKNKDKEVNKVIDKEINKDKDKETDKEVDKDIEKEISIKNISDIDKFYIVFENLDDFKKGTIKSILYQHNADEKLNYNLFKNIINSSKIINEFYKNVKNIKEDIHKSFDIIICITEGISITFLKINDIIDL